MIASRMRVYLAYMAAATLTLVGARVVVVILHESAHALVGVLFGGEFSGISLYWFGGGLTHVDFPYSFTPRHARVAFSAAGPFSDVALSAIGLVCWTLCGWARRSMIVVMGTITAITFQAMSLLRFGIGGSLKGNQIDAVRIFQ